MPIATPTQNSSGSPSWPSSSAPPAPLITLDTSVQPRPSAPNTSGCPSRFRMPAAGSTAMGNWRLRPIFCMPWNRRCRRAPAGRAVLSALMGLATFPTVV
ncbi:hypothetical protein SCANM63S_05096 [Streptomyces canarius]